MTTHRKIKTVRYFDPSNGCHVTKEVVVPPPATVHELSTGATVQEIGSMEELKSLWRNDILQDVMTPLTSHSRQVLRQELQRVLTEPDEHEAINHLAASWHANDDRVLRLIGRLIGEAEKQRIKRERQMSRRETLLHEKNLWLDEKKRLKDEVKALTADISKLVNERDEAKKAAANTKGTVYLEGQLRQTQERLKQVEQERDILRRDAQRNVEIALTEYESTVMEKLGSVAADHKVAVEENKELKNRVATLREALASKVTMQDTTVPKGSVTMSENVSQTTNDVPEVETLRCGDEVHCKISGEGPFVLITQVEEGTVRYANPVPGTKNHFHAGDVPIANPWLVRDRTGAMQCLPAAILTKQAPKRAISFGGVKRLVTSDVTAKLFQAAIWVAMLTLLYLRH